MNSKNTKDPGLQRACISAVIHSGLRVTTSDGKPARLAIIDDAGNVIEDSPQVAREAWAVAQQSYRNFLKGQGHLVVHTTPTGIEIASDEKH